ncbi:MAG: AsmA family protein [Candidatus Zixiibacteriota bacterium]|nr:MAG: AsmA family protein [candidate division Zixibacteria bacterium]
MRRAVKVIGWVAGIIIGVLILAIIGLWLFFPVEKAKDMAVEKGSAQLGRTITVESADISFWGGLGVKLGNVTVGNPPEMAEGQLLTAENVDVKLRILPLLTGNYKIDRLVINHPEISMVKRRDGVNNFTFKTLEKKAPPELAEKAAPEAKAAAVAVTFDKLVINHGSLTYVDDSSGVSFGLNDLDLSTSLTSPRKNLYRSSGEISIASAVLPADLPLPPLSLKLNYHADYDFDAKLITFDETELELSKLKFDLKGDVSDPTGQLKSKMTVKSAKISVGDFLSLLPPEKLEATRDITITGDFALDLDLEYDPNNIDTLTYYGTAVVTGMNLTHREVSGEFKFKRALIDFKNNNLRFNIEEGYFDSKPVKGHLVVDNFSDPTVNGELAGTLNLAYLQPFLPAEGGHQVAGESQFDLKLSGKTNDFAAMNFSGSVKVAGGKYSSALLFEPVESFDLDVYFDNRLTHVKKLTGRMKSGNLAFEGRLNDLVPYFLADSVTRPVIHPTIDGEISGKVDLAIANGFLPPKGDPELNGQLETRIKLTGVLTQYDKLKPGGTLSIRQASYTDSLLPEPVTHFEADMVISPDTITISNMTARFVSSDATFSGKLANPFPYLLPVEGVDRTEVKKPIFLFKLSSHRFDTDKMFPEAVPGSGENRATMSLDSVSTFILPDIDGLGTFEADTIIYSGVELTSIQGKIKIHDRKIECYDAIGKVYTGDVAGNTTIDLNDFAQPRYSGEFKASNVEANDFISRFTRFGGMVFGKVNLEGDYAARGWEPTDFIKSLNMNSAYTQLEGKLVTSGVVYSLLNELAEQAGQSFNNEQALKDLKTNILVKDGRVGLDKLKTKLGKVGDVELGGFYGLLSNEIDFSGTILLSEEWTQKLFSQKGLLSGLAGLLTDKSVNRVKLPIAFGGTPNKPEFKIDYDALTESLGDDLKKDAGDLLKNLFKKK